MTPSHSELHSRESNSCSPMRPVTADGFRCGLICYGDIQDMAVPGLAKKRTGNLQPRQIFF